MGFEKIFVVKSNVADDAKTVCNDSKDTGGIKDSHGSKGRIKFLADRFGQIVNGEKVISALI